MKKLVNWLYPILTNIWFVWTYATVMLLGGLLLHHPVSAQVVIMLWCGLVIVNSYQVRRISRILDQLRKEAKASADQALAKQQYEA